jgi:hypothetical protein
VVGNRPLWIAGGLGIIALLFGVVFSGNAVLFLKKMGSLAHAFAALLQKGTVCAYNDFGVSWPFGVTRLGDGTEGGPEVFGAYASTRRQLSPCERPSIQVEESC